MWRKSAFRSLLGSFSDPLLYLLALGYGLGQFVGEVEGLPYIAFLGSGIIASSAMNTATFEGLYMAYTRMEVQRTWDGMLAAPLGIADIVLGEILWMGTKSVISAGAILCVITALGLVHSWMALCVIPIGFITGICFGSMALVITSYSNSYEFFLYYITLVVTPMILLSGVFFPLSSLPVQTQQVSSLLPLQHIVALNRSLMSGQLAIVDALHLLIPAGFIVVATAFAIYRLRKRMLQ